MTNENQETITFTPESFRSFKKLWAVSAQQGDEQFTFEGHEFLTAYAKYLIEYIETRKKQ